MAIEKIQVKHFRCFNNETFDFENAPVVLIEGNNGKGKTSLLEALYYLGALRSFRTYSSRDLINFQNTSFFLQGTIQDNMLTIGCNGTQKVVKLNNNHLQSYKDLRDILKVVLIAENELSLITEGPERRRFFLDLAIAFFDHDYVAASKRYKQILQQRNALLLQATYSPDEHILWTQKLWHEARFICQERAAYIVCLEALLRDCFPDNPFSFSLTYTSRNILEHTEFDKFYISMKKVFERERYLKRTLFGPHLDELAIEHEHKLLRTFSSRGQQKFVVCLIKLAQLSHLKEINPLSSLILLLDDFVTDFDPFFLSKLIEYALSLKVQLIFTSPLSQGAEKQYFSAHSISYKHISL